MSAKNMSASRRKRIQLLFLAVTSLETSHAAAGIENLLFSGVERVAL